MKRFLFLVSFCCCFSAQASLSNIFKELTQFNAKNRQHVGEVFDNFYTVDEGQFYRSHLLPPQTLDKYIKKIGIKTVLHLCGELDGESCASEKAVAEQNGIFFFSLSMSAVYLTNNTDLMKVLTIFQEAPRPILVHCMGGADRTGEVSALWVLDQQKKDKSEAFKQLAITYGHRKYKNSAKDFLIEIWQGREWAFNVYDHRNYPSLCRPSDLR